MADVSVSAQNLISNVTNDVKARFSFDLSGQELGGGPFLDAMMAGRNDISDNDLKAVVDKMDKADMDASRAISETKISLKNKIKSRVKEIVDRDQTPVKDDRAIKALKKVATFLLKADAEGKIDLPPELVQKLNEFLSQADDLKAAGMADFMHGFIQSFRDIKINLSLGTAVGENGEALTWPQEIVDAFKDLQLGGYATANAPLDMMSIIKAVKALVNTSETAAKQTLNEKAQEALQAKDPASVVVPVAVIAEKAEAPAIDTILASDAQTKAVEVAAQISAEIKTGKETVKAPEVMSLAAALAEEKKSAAAAPVAAVPLTKALIDKAALAEKRIDAVAKDLGKPVIAPLTNNAAVRVETAQLAAAAAADVKPAGLAGQNAASFSSNSPISVAGLDQPGNVTANNTRFAAAVNSTTQAAAQLKNGAVEQVIVQLQNRAGKSSQISIQLSPAELGRVDVRLDVRRDGTTHAIVTADKPETLALLQKDASQLEKALQQAGLNANSENMSFNLREERQANQGFGRKRLGRDSVIDAPVKELALNVQGDGNVISDTRVNYHA